MTKNVVGNLREVYKIVVRLSTVIMVIAFLSGSSAYGQGRYDKSYSTLASEAAAYLNSVGKGSQGYAVGIAPHLSRIWRDGGPSLSWMGPVTVSMAKGEMEHRQLAVIPLSGALTSVVLSASALTAPGIQGGPTMTVGPIGYVMSDVGGQQVSTPDVMLNQYPFTVTAGQLQGIYVLVETTTSTAAGTYTGTITVQPSGKAAEQIQVQVTVWDFALPKEPPLHGWWSTLDYAFLLKHKLEPGWWDPPFDLNDAVTDAEWAAAKTSVQNWFNDGHSFLMIRTPGCYLNGSGVGASGNEPMPTYTQQQIDNMIVYWRGMARILDSIGKLDHAGIYVWDEPHYEKFPQVVQICQWIHQANPRLKTVSAGWWDLRAYRDNGNLDCYCPISFTFDPNVDRTGRPNGSETWWYVCITPGAPYPNVMTNNLPIEQRVLGWQSWRFGATGMLYWDTLRAVWDRTATYNPPSTDCGSINGSGDGTLVYLTGGTVASLRLRHLADGMEDMQYIQMLNDLLSTVDKTHPDPSNAAWRQARQQARAALGRVVSVSGATTIAFTKDASTLLSARNDIANAIVSLGQFAGGP